MTNPHRMVVTEPDTVYGNRIVCDAAVGDPCRLYCDETECEEGTTENHSKHALRDQGYCVRTEGWFDDGAAENYDGDILPLLPLHDGPVVLRWTGDWMVWSYEPAPILCPECGNGKCVNCIEQTLNDADEWVPCGCPEHGEPNA